MDLRSAHKTPEKPPPRLRLSLTRSLLPEDEEQMYAASRQGPRQLAHRKSKQGRSQFGCLDSNPPSPTEVDWEGQEMEEEEEEEDNVEDDEGRDMEEEEEEQDEARKETAKKSKGILNGMCVSRSVSGL